MQSISHILPRACAMFADRPAVLDGEGMTYGALGRRVARLAGALLGCGLAPGDRVAVLDNNSPRFLEAYYACAMAGLVLVPMNTRLAPPEQAHVLNDSGARLLILAAPFFPLYQAVRGDLAAVETVLVHGGGPAPEGGRDYEAALAAAEPHDGVHCFAPDDVCQIYYTSGTTGRPKGVCLTSGNMVASAIDSIIEMQLTERDVFLHAAPLFHLVDAWAVWALPLLGAAQATLHFTPEGFLHAVATTRSTVTCLPATLINMLADHPGLAASDLSSLRFIAYGGSPTPLGILQRAVRAMPTLYLHSYGATETSGLITLARAEDFCVDGPPEKVALTASAGRAVPHIALAVVDEDDRPVRAGEIGEIVIGGPRVMRGYWNRPEETAAALRGGRYHTGDLGFLDERQRLFIVDRKKDMIITGGENVYSVEVESLLSTHPAVGEVAIIGVPDPRWSEAVKAIIVLRDGAQASEEELIAFCRGKIAGYKLPKSVEFRPDPLPKSGPGKIAKRQLRDPYWAQERRSI